MTPKNFRRLARVMPWLVLLGTLILWDLSVRIFQLKAFILPSPLAVYNSFIQYRGIV